MLDKDLRPEHIQSISNASEVVSFFSYLGYNTSEHITQFSANLGITNESLIKDVKKIELIANHDGLLQVYLFELSSVTVANTQALARIFRNRVGNYLLVLTSDYDRIDFVLIERLLPSEKDEGIGTKQASIRPRILTVDRLKPTRIDQRVLRRFSYTETDPIAQYEKLQAAYIVADWSEEFFNNRALFSDYYLLERLRDEPEWKENIKPVYSRFREIYQDAKSLWSGKSEQEFRKGFLNQVFETLGYSFKESKRADDDSKEPDYIFYGDKQSDSLLCFCLTYPWGRSLDGKDYTRDINTPDENPGAVVVSLLDRGDTDWVIVTNGKLWRLYSSKAHSRATNYYEIDLEEVLARLDPEESFRYFFLFFRKEAFVGYDEEQKKITFLDRLLKGSEEYAKRLGERLKKRVFEEIFPYFAKGFISYIQDVKGVPSLSQSELDGLFQGTLTFLYRLLFLLYSESRNLLPVREMRGYHGISLSAIKSEIADTLGDASLNNKELLSLKIQFDSSSTVFYDRLQTLFKAIDTGDITMNVPAYNGGLFMTTVNPEDDSQEAVNARLLIENKVPDKFFAMGLDLLTRDEDEKTFKRVFIDYKSLGVRHLGSIYEGLLEFHLRIAPEKMAICEGKKTEEIIPYTEALKQKKKILKTGRGKDAEERILPKGAVYLENTKHERKATGSYYTPDYIVKYIVENTVGPVLKERFETLTPKFREAQWAYREAVSRAKAFEKKGMKGDDPEKTAFTFKWLVDELFDNKVLDPAMGSGHFLVEAVDFITDKMIDFLNGFPWNPVMATLRETRDTILKEMEKQNIIIDETRLNDLNLLKRHVLKRCIYGVDLNHMAVELAKVSLWLDCFTLGAPLSFLDHHLKCGNSLIGATVVEVKEAVEPVSRQISKSKVVASAKEWKEIETVSNQAALFGSRFAGLMLATDLMRHVGELSDVTATQVRESRAEYKKASDTLSPFKRIFDIYVSQWFGNDGDSKNKKKKTAVSPAIDFLRSKEAETFISTKDINKVLEKLSEGDRKIAGNALNIAREKRFFHWELEFPEVFYGKGREKENPGFDAVVGNPPYDVLASEELGFDVSHDLTFYELTDIYKAAMRGARNLYKLFICRGVNIVKANGYFSYIVPMTIMGDEQASALRKIFLSRLRLLSIEAFPQKDDPDRRVFPEAKLSTAILVVINQNNRAPFTVRTHAGKYIESSSQTLHLSPDEISRFDPGNYVIPSCTQRDWNIANAILSSKIQRLGSLARCFRGDMEQTKEIRAGTLGSDKKGPLVLRGSNITVYAVREASQGEDLYLDVKKFFDNIGNKSKAAINYGKRKIGYQRSAPQNNFRRLIAAPLQKESFCFDTVSYVSESSSKIDLDLLLAFFNSKILDWYFRLGSTNSKVNEYQFDALPVPTLSDTGKSIEWKKFLKEGKWDALSELLHSGCSEAGIMPKDVAEALAEMSREIQRIEGQRVLKNRKERSSLAPESQQIQDVIDKVLFRCYGLSDEEGAYIAKRLQEML
jgi:hypothetical protein